MQPSKVDTNSSFLCICMLVCLHLIDRKWGGLKQLPFGRVCVCVCVPLVGVFTLKGPVNNDNLRHEMVPTSCPSGTRVHPDNVSCAGELFRDRLPQTLLSLIHHTFTVIRPDEGTLYQTASDIPVDESHHSFKSKD